MTLAVKSAKPSAQSPPWRTKAWPSPASASAAFSRREGRKAVMKLVVCQRTRCVLGAHMLGEDAPEIMQGIGVAVAMGATKEDFDRTIGIHPTAAEEFVTLRTRTREAGVRAAAE